jgi:5-methylcytosine-specific restriction enzyme B
MSFADDVREHCRTHYVIPARARGDSSVEIRAGDVHAALRYKNRMPLVCSAIGTKTFEQTSRLERLALEGPANGANATFTFRVF